MCPAGNYDTFMKTVAENEIVQMKKYQKEQEDIKHIKEFIASCGERKLDRLITSMLQGNTVNCTTLVVGWLSNWAGRHALRGSSSAVTQARGHPICKYSMHVVGQCNSQHTTPPASIVRCRILLPFDCCCVVVLLLLLLCRHVRQPCEAGQVQAEDPGQDG
jgi:hypothetical protein